MTKNLFIISGANGSGKSTLASELLTAKQLEFLNADDIAKEICPEHIESVKITAGKELIRRLKMFFEQETSFAIETTLAGSNHIKTIKQAKQLGYKVSLIYTFVENPEICIQRIKVRVLSGGHNIPDEDVIRRYYRSKNNFWNKYKDIVDDWDLFYNGISNYSLIAKNEEDGLEILNDAIYNEFVKDISK